MSVAATLQRAQAQASELRQIYRGILRVQRDWPAQKDRSHRLSAFIKSRARQLLSSKSAGPADLAYARRELDALREMLEGKVLEKVTQTICPVMNSNHQQHPLGEGSLMMTVLPPRAQFQLLDLSSQQSLSKEKVSTLTFFPTPVYPLSPKRQVPDHIARPDYAVTGDPISERKLRNSSQIEVLNKEDIEHMRVVCKIGREVLEIAKAAVQVGVSTDEIDRIVHEATIARNAYPSPLNYYGFPKSCCTSVNEVICHGIPDRYELKDGDILNIDISVFYNGFHSDLNETVYVGNVDETGKKLVETTRECLQKAIEFVKPGMLYRDIGEVIQKVADAANFSVVRSYTGHGVNKYFHCSPTIPHYAKNKAVGVMKAGHVFTIEPMICEGTWRDEQWPDRWTVVTTDGKRSAQFEETLLVTETGVEILTRP
ncbi:Methionine aminopeptidase 1 [Entophlyctis luteolus]|nr:Methionine aminopeptidase 1 [Entophlyctis luteolus]